MREIREPAALKTKAPRGIGAAAPLADDWTQTGRGAMFARCGGWQVERIPVVMVHGLVVSSSYMVPTAELLAPLCPVFAVDLPGFGKSFKPEHTLSIVQLANALEEWLAAKGLGRVHLVGNSMGCQVIAQYAAQHPERIERIVLQGATVDPHARAFWPQFWRQFRNSPNEKSGLGLVIAKDYLAAGVKRAVQTAREALRDRIEEKLPLLEMPVLVVRGEKDPICPQAWAAEMVRLLPRGELRVIPGGHCPNYSMPAEFLSAMRPFLGL